MTQGAIEFKLEVATVPTSMGQLNALVRSFFADDVNVSISRLEWDQIEVTPHDRAPRQFAQGTAKIHGWAQR